jgi:hypothetical protein
MHSNIEQALVNVMATQQKVVLSRVLEAYMRVAGFKLQTQHALNAFERALDKYPDSTDKVDSDFAKLISELRQSWWHLRFMASEDAEGKCSACPSCGVMMLVDRMFNGDPTQWNVAFRMDEELSGAFPLCFVFIFLRLTLYNSESEEVKDKTR